MVCAHVEDGDEVWVRNGRKQLGLALESCKGLSCVRKAFRQHFDGHVPIETPIPGTIYLAHPSGTERREDLVVRQFHSCVETHSSHPWWARVVVGDLSILPIRRLVQRPVADDRGGSRFSPSSWARERSLQR